MIRVGVAGFGKIGKVRVEEINKNPNTELVAIFDLNKSNELDGVLFCNSFDELINLDLDAVFKGEKTWFDLLKGNKAVSVAIAAIFGGSLFVSIFSIAGSMALKLLGFIGKGAFMTALAVNPAILKGIGIGMIAVGLYNMAIDGIEEYNKTQDVSKAFSTALAGKGK